MHWPNPCCWGSADIWYVTLLVLIYYTVRRMHALVEQILYIYLCTGQILAVGAQLTYVMSRCWCSYITAKSLLLVLSILQTLNFQILSSIRLFRMTICLIVCNIAILRLQLSHNYIKHFMASLYQSMPLDISTKDIAQ